MSRGITNSICTNNTEMDISSNGGNINIANDGSMTTVNMGGALKVLALTDIGAIVNDGSGNVSSATAFGQTGLVLTSNGSFIPSFQALPPITNQIDDITLKNSIQLHSF